MGSQWKNIQLLSECRVDFAVGETQLIIDDQYTYYAVLNLFCDGAKPHHKRAAVI
jgi:hypothetical protein